MGTEWASDSDADGIGLAANRCAYLLLSALGVSVEAQMRVHRRGGARAVHVAHK
jgi:hypothetical protein